jgi:hypothetical protein
VNSTWQGRNNFSYLWTLFSGFRGMSTDNMARDWPQMPTGFSGINSFYTYFAFLQEIAYEYTECIVSTYREGTENHPPISDCRKENVLM